MPFNPAPTPSTRPPSPPSALPTRFPRCPPSSRATASCCSSTSPTTFPSSVAFQAAMPPFMGAFFLLDTAPRPRVLLFRLRLGLGRRVRPRRFRLFDQLFGLFELPARHLHLVPQNRVLRRSHHHRGNAIRLQNSADHVRLHFGIHRTGIPQRNH